MSQEALTSFSSIAKSIVVGNLYEHYKGLRYKVIGMARHSETLEELVVYQALYGECAIWVRPLNMFLENIVVNGQSRPRFKLVQFPEAKDAPHQSDCLFCQIASGERKVKCLKTFSHCYAIKDEFPVSDGHILIIPNEHTENWFTAREEVRLDMMKAVHLLKTKLDLEYRPDGYNIGANCGEAAGQSVMHLHLHLIPRYQGDMDNPKGGVRGVIPSKQKY